MYSNHRIVLCKTVNWVLRCANSISIDRNEKVWTLVSQSSQKTSWWPELWHMNSDQCPGGWLASNVRPGASEWLRFLGNPPMPGTPAPPAGISPPTSDLTTATQRERGVEDVWQAQIPFLCFRPDILDPRHVCGPALMPLSCFIIVFLLSPLPNHKLFESKSFWVSPTATTV